MNSPTNIKENRLNRIQWSKEPYLTTLEDYGVARNRFVQHLTKRPELIAVYQHGEPTLPGISDLDLVLVLEDRLTESRPQDFSALMFFGEDHFAFPNEPAIVPKTVFYHLQEAFPLPRLKAIHGTKLMQETYTQEEKSLLYTSHTIGQLSFYWLGCARRLVASMLSIRSTLTFLNGIVHNLKTIHAVTGKNLAQSFIEKVDSLRRNWFNETSNRIECLETLLNEVPEVLAIAILFMDQYLADQRLLIPTRDVTARVKTSDGGAIVYKSLSGISVAELASMIRRWNFKNPLRTKTSWRCPVVMLPGSFGAQLGYYAAEGKGVMTKILRSDFQDHFPMIQEIDPCYSYWLKRRIAVMDYHASFLVDNGFRFGGLFSTVTDPPHRRQVNKPIVHRLKRNMACLVVEVIRPLWIASRGGLALNSFGADDAYHAQVE